MSVASFKENSLGWTIELGKQRVQEWWELKISQIEIDSPDFSVLDSPLTRMLIKIILWSIIAAILVWLTWQLWLWLRPTIKNWRRQRRQLKRSLNLTYPIESQLSPQDWLNRAQQYYQQQNYRQGIFCLYQGILQYLSDRKNIITLSSRTDGEYLKLIEQLSLKQFLSYQLLFLTHEKLCFSQRASSADLFEECHRAYQIITHSEK